MHLLTKCAVTCPIEKSKHSFSLTTHCGLVVVGDDYEQVALKEAQRMTIWPTPGALLGTWWRSVCGLFPGKGTSLRKWHLGWIVREELQESRPEVGKHSPWWGCKWFLGCGCWLCRAEKKPPNPPPSCAIESPVRVKYTQPTTKTI